MLNCDPSNPPLLHELEPFAALEAIAKWFEVEFILFGGTATRMAMHLAYHGDDKLDLFEIVPFTSDIDLVHTGGPSLSEPLKQAIRQRVPFSTWFRWSLMDWRQWQAVEQNIAAGTDIPLRTIRFSTAHSLPWGETATQDLEQQAVSVRRRDGFAESSFAKQGRTLEIFSLFLAMNTEAEMRDISGAARLHDIDGMRRWLDREKIDHAGQGALARAEDNRLAVRAWHLGATRWARNDGITDDIAADWYREAGVFEALRLSDVGQKDASFTVSKATVSGDFRVPQLLPHVSIGAKAEAQVRSALERISAQAEVRPMIDPAFRVVGFVDKLTVSTTATAADETQADAAFGSLPDGEFLQLSWRSPEKINLTAALLPASGSVPEPQPPVPAVGGTFPGGRSWLRIDIEELARRKDGTDRSGTDVSLVILAPRAMAAAELEPPEHYAPIPPDEEQNSITEERQRRLRELARERNFKLSGSAS